MKHIHFVSLFTVLFCASHIVYGSYLDNDAAVLAIAPAADADGKPLSAAQNERPVEEIHRLLPYSPEVGPGMPPSASVSF